MVGIRLKVRRLLRLAAGYTCGSLPSLLPVLFILGATLTLVVYTPIPQHFCKAGQGYGLAPNRGDCNAMLALFDKFSHTSTVTQSMTGNIATFAGLRYSSSLTQLTANSVRPLVPIPILVEGVARRIVQALFALSIVWPRLLEPGRVLGDSRRGGDRDSKKSVFES